MRSCDIKTPIPVSLRIQSARVKIRETACELLFHVTKIYSLFCSREVEGFSGLRKTDKFYLFELRMAFEQEVGGL